MDGKLINKSTAFIKNWIIENIIDDNIVDDIHLDEIDKVFSQKSTWVPYSIAIYHRLKSLLINYDVILVIPLAEEYHKMHIPELLNEHNISNTPPSFYACKKNNSRLCETIEAGIFISKLSEIYGLKIFYNESFEKEQNRIIYYRNLLISN